MSSLQPRRIARHAIVAVASAAGVLGVAALLPDGVPAFRASMGTAYTSLALLVVTLAIGPFNALRRRPNPVSTNVRRDIGIWSAILALTHVVFGLQVHLPGRTWEYFVWGAGDAHAIPIRYDVPGMTNWAGLAAALLLTLLLAISNDVSLRRLGARRWKSVQRWVYAAFCLVALHGVLYQVLERRTLPWVLVHASLIGAIVVVQLAGFASVRRAVGGKFSRPQSSPRADRT